MWYAYNIQAREWEGPIIEQNASQCFMPHPLCHFSFCAPSFSLLYQMAAHTHTLTHAHTHTHTAFVSHRLEYISWWPQQVTDGDLTAPLTVNWVLIKPKHVWEMLIIHCRLREAGVQSGENIVSTHVQRVSLLFNHFPHCDKPVSIIIHFCVAVEKCEARWTGCHGRPWMLQPSSCIAHQNKYRWELD